MEELPWPGEVSHEKMNQRLPCEGKSHEMMTSRCSLFGVGQEQNVANENL